MKPTAICLTCGIRRSEGAQFDCRLPGARCDWRTCQSKKEVRAAERIAEERSPERAMHGGDAASALAIAPYAMGIRAREAARQAGIDWIKTLTRFHQWERGDSSKTCAARSEIEDTGDGLY